jgi:hypothetical protein
MEGDTTGSEPALDLATQYEALLAAVWAAEENWRLDDRITLSVDLEKHRRRRPAR